MHVGNILSKWNLRPTDLKFIIDGHFTSSPYCVILQARETIRGKLLHEDASVCVHTNQTLAARGVEFLPQPERLRDEKSRNTKRITSNPEVTGETKVSSPVSAAVTFPENVELLQNASDFSRVVEPIQQVTDNKVRWFLLILLILQLSSLCNVDRCVYVAVECCLATSTEAVSVRAFWNYKDAFADGSAVRASLRGVLLVDDLHLTSMKTFEWGSKLTKRDVDVSKKII